MNRLEVIGRGGRSVLLGVVGAVVVAVLVLGALGGGRPESSVAPGGVSPGAGERSAVASNGAVAGVVEELGDLEFDTEFGVVWVDDVRRVARPGIRTLAAQESAVDDSFVELSLRLQNTSGGEVVFAPGEVVLEVGDSSSSRYPAQLASSSVSGAVVRPGDELTVEVGFLVPADQSRLRLGYLDERGRSAGKVDIRFADDDLSGTQ